MIDIYSLNKKRDQLRNKKINYYKKVLQKCYKKIKITADKPKSSCYFIIPTFTIGIPLYDLNDCIIYIKRTLEKQGFLTLFFKPNALFISWEHIPSNNEKEKKYKNYNRQIKKNYLYRPITDIPNTSGFIYDLKENDRKLNQMF